MRALLALMASSILAGCTSMASPLGIHRDNRFPEVPAEAPPSELVGTWTGGTGLYLSTMVLKADGRGQFCNSLHTHESVGSIKWSGGQLYAQSGDRLNLSKSGNVVVMSFEDPKLPRSRLVPDPKLVEASPYCRKELGNKTPS